jgi:hypothetical protein
MAVSTVDPSTRHPEYNAHERVVRTCYDAFYGNVRHNKYVPKLTEQSNEQYEAYVGRPFYLNATERTVQSIIGVLTKQPLVVTGSEDVIVEDAANLNGLVQDLIMDITLGGRVLLIVDYDEGSGPYLEYYPSQQIINWSDDFIMLEGQEMVRDPDNPYKSNPMTYWKEYFLDENGYFAARYWTKEKNGTYKASEVTYLIVNGEPVSGMQAFWITPYDNSEELYNPPVKSVAELNVSHFRLSCDQYHALHYLAVPTFTVIGGLMPDENGQISRRIVLGSTTEALHLADGSDAKFVEFSGQGISSIYAEKDRIEQLMAQYGARLLSPKAGVESAQSIQLRAESELSVLETMANAIQNALDAAMVLYSDMVGVNITVTLPTPTVPGFVSEPAQPIQVPTLEEDEEL